MTCSCCKENIRFLERYYVVGEIPLAEAHLRIIDDVEFGVRRGQSWVVCPKCLTGLIGGWLPQDDE